MRPDPGLAGGGRGVTGTVAGMATRPATPVPGRGDTGPPGDRVDAASGPTAATAGSDAWARGPRPIHVTLALLAVVALPLVVALVVLHSPRWYPIGDLAQTELRVREVGTADTPLVGLAGRIGPPEDPGSHPGPLGFYALTPVYRLLGSTPFALQVSSAALGLLAAGLAIGIARRRGGWLFALGTAAVLAVLVRSLGPRVLTEPWNPYIPVLWWVVVLLSVWSVWCDDDALLPVAVGAACLASQTHVPYAGLVAVVLGATALRLAWRAVRARRGAEGVQMPSGVAVAVAVAVGVVAWIPPLVDELTGDPGNITVIVRYFLGGEGEAVGLGSGGSLWLSRLDPLTLLTGTLDGPVAGNRVLGALFVLVWVAAAVLAWRRGHTALLRLHQVAGLAALAGLASMSRIYGALHYYLVLWAWSTTAVAVLAVVATGARALGVAAPDRRLVRAAGGAETSRVADASGAGPAVDADGVADPAGARRGGSPTPAGAARPAPGGSVRPAGPARAAAAVGVVVLVVAAAAGVVGARGATQSSSVHSETLAEVTPPTVAALESGEVPGGGEGPYEVRADDPYVIGVQAYGLFTELRREGIDARLPARLESTAGDHVVGPDEQVPVIVVATGPRVEDWRARPAAVEVASADPRSPEEAARQEELFGRVQRRLREEGRADQADMVEQNLLVVAVDGEVPSDVRDDLDEIIDLGAPTGVFVAPAGAP